MTSASAVTFVIGDGFALNGSGSFGTVPDDNPESSPGNSGRDGSITNAELSSRYNVTAATFSDSVFADPFIAGVFSGFGPGDVYRSSLQYDLSGLPSLSGSQTWQVTDVTLFLEVAGTTFDNGVPNSGDSVDIDVIAGGDITAATLPAAAASFSIDNADESTLERNFISVVLPASVLDLNSDSSVTFLLDAGASPTTAAMFGTSLGDDGLGISGTDFINRAPALRINAEIVPEPSVFSLGILAGLGLLARRRR